MVASRVTGFARLLSLGASVLVLAAWFALAVYFVTSVAAGDCLTSSVPDYHENVDCGDARRGAFVLILAAGAVAVPVAAVLSLPYFLLGRDGRP